MMTPYGPGKFAFEADRVVYQKSLEATEVEYYSPYFGWFGVVLGPLAPDWEGATDEDREYLASPAFLIAEDEQGFVYVRPFDRAHQAYLAFDEWLVQMDEEERALEENDPS